MDEVEEMTILVPLTFRKKRSRWTFFTEKHGHLL
jgi:hypothetical protein